MLIIASRKAGICQGLCKADFGCDATSASEMIHHLLGPQCTKVDVRLVARPVVKHATVRVRVCVCVFVCVRACVRACVCASAAMDSLELF